MGTGQEDVRMGFPSVGERERGGGETGALSL